MTRARPKPDQTIDVDLSDTPDSADYDSTLAQILTEFSTSPAENEYNVKVYRVPVRPDGTGIRGLKPEYLFEGDQTVVPGIMDYCRDTPGYGTGTYRAIIRRDNLPFRQFDFRVFKPGSAMVPVQAPSNENNALSPVVDRLLQRLERLEEKITAPVPQIDEMVRLRTMSEIMSNLRGPVVQEQPRESMKDSFALMTTMFAFAEKVVGKGGGGADISWMDVLKSAIDNGAIQEIAKNGIQFGAPKPPAQVQANPAQRQISPAPPQPVPENIPSDMIRIPIGNGQFLNVPTAIHARLNETVLTLCRRARTNANDSEKCQPPGYVDFVLDELEDIDASGSLSVQIVGNEGSLALLNEAFPVTLPYKVWFDELLSECRKAIAGDADGSSENCAPGFPTGNHAGNAQDHAGLDTAGEA